jgi:phosphatidate cytidylyltransferase
MNELTKRIFTSILLICLLISMFVYNYMFIIILIIFGTIIWVELNNLFIKIFKNNYLKILVNFLVLIYIFYILWLSMISFQSNDTKIVLLYTILVCIMSDIGGYFFGKTFKGKKLTKISPNKTISGLIGAFIFSLLFLIVFNFIIESLDLIKYLILTLAVSSTSQLGDIFISYIKRKAKVKNTSNILPGHGGLLDRVDGIIFAIPIGLNLAILLS